MIKRIKDISLGLIIGIILASTTTSTFANSILQKIDVAFNTVKVEINGEKLDSPNILYDGTTYLPMRTIAEVVGKDVEWNQKTKTANIIDKKITVNEVENMGFSDFIKNFKQGEIEDGYSTNSYRCIFAYHIDQEIDIDEVLKSYDIEEIKKYLTNILDKIYTAEFLADKVPCDLVVEYRTKQSNLTSDVFAVIRDRDGKMKYMINHVKYE